MMKKVDSFVRLDILEEHKRSIMSILSDWEIKHLVEKENMIEPFVAKEIKEINGKKTLSYGLSSYGYDIRLSEETCSLFGGTQTGMCDPKDFDFEILKSTTLNEDERGKYFLLPPFGYCLCRAEEKIKLPKDITVVAVGKSSYARSGIFCNITPAESGWEGYLTLQITNCTSLFNRIYANEGITQLQFHRGNPCDIDYPQRKNNKKIKKEIAKV